MSHDHQSHSHFKGKEALEHVIEAQASGLVSSSEVHGTESPGYLSAGCDAARETSLLLVLISLFFTFLHVPEGKALSCLIILSISWFFWKLGRAAWLGWFRLERLHRILDQERYEIEHHRQQERDELRVLYAAKGFEGKLLEDVLDVLMADNARLLKVMVEEELGLSLASQEHPLKQGMGGAIGVALSSFVVLSAAALIPSVGLYLGSIVMMGAPAYFLARLNDNEPLPAIVWNIGLGSISFAIVFFLLKWLTN